MKATSVKVLFVGTRRNLAESELFADPETELRVAAAEELDESLLKEFAPSTIITPLFSEQHDCYDVAARLSAAEFSGTLLLLAKDLPRPEAVLREVSQRFPNLEIDIEVRSASV